MKNNFMSGKHWIIVLIIIITGYQVYKGLSNKTNWTSESRKIMIEKCISDSKEMAEKYPELTKEYCICSTESIQTEFTQKEYIKISKESIEIQTKKLLPSFQNCLTEYQNEIKKKKEKPAHNTVHN
jgi:hypothetical protein